MASPKKDEELTWARKQIEQYKQVYPKYEKCAEILQEVLSQAAKKICPSSFVQTRPKSLSSFGEKIWRYKNEYDDPVNQFYDLCGGRVITHTQKEAEKICEFVKNNFQVDEEKSRDICQTLPPSQFGYRAIHFIVNFKPNAFQTEDVNVDIPSNLYDVKMEIQVKTLLAHAWAVFAHDRSYKSSFKIPDKYERALNAVSASLESADQALSEIDEGLQEYASNYDAYMSKPEILEEIEKLEIILELKPDDQETAYRIGKLARNIENWKKVIDTLSSFTESGYQPILRELGIALCQYNKKNPQSADYKRGQEYLQRATEASKNDTDAICSLAGTWKGIDDEKAKELYYEAFKLDPSYSYAIGNFLNYEVARTNDLSILRLSHPTIEAAIQRCRSQIEIKVNLPWAYFDIGKFNLLMEKHEDSISAYARAIKLSPAEWMIRRTLDGLEKILGRAKAKITWYEWIVRFLALGQLAKSVTTEEKKQATDRIKTYFPNLNTLSGSVIIIAGGCNEKAEAIIQSYRKTVHEAFNGFKGTLISGGTKSGVSGLAAELAEKNPTIRAYGYLPKKIPETAFIDTRYSEIRHTEGDNFSPLEPLQYWADIITSGIEPSQVKLLGINGGKISAAEYRIALGMGAKVAVIEEKEGAAADLSSDPNWKDSEMLASIPPEKTFIRSFIFSQPCPEEVSPEIINHIAKAIHNEYKQDRGKSLAKKDPAMADWSTLKDDLRESNLQQASNIFQQLRDNDYTVRKITNPSDPLIQFTNVEIERMAEMEHARWVIERLLRGWKFAKERDVEHKKSPYLVPWAQLCEEIKDVDRKAVSKIPEYLSEVGLEIRRKPVDGPR